MIAVPKLALAVLLAAFSTGCAGSGPEVADASREPSPPADAPEAVDDRNPGYGAGDSGDERAAWSRPREVFEFLGITAGSRVVDLMAGNGYNAIVLAEMVGPAGRVIVEGGNEELRGRVLGGDLAAHGHIEFVDDVHSLADGSADFVVAVRAYHLFPDVPGVLAELRRALVAGGVVGIVEVRLDQDEGHDMSTHRMGEQTVISQMLSAGFEFVGSSDLLRRSDDVYSHYAPPGRTRFMTDRMLLKFRKVE